MAEQTKKIRDFIYLDGDKLYSLYSQVNEGIAQQIVQSKLKGEQQNKTGDSPMLEGGAIESTFSLLVHSTENKVLHDYMYAELEDQIRDSIFEPADITQDNFEEKLKDKFLIKIKGNAEITDYARLKAILNRINDLATGIAYITEFAQLGMKVYELKALIESVKDKKKQQELQKYLKKFENPAEFAKTSGLYQDVSQMKHIEFFTDFFYSNGIEITIKVSFDKESEIDFRGIINENWLRIKSEFIRMLYNGVSDNWTMVGQITFISNPEKKGKTILQTASEVQQSEEKKQEDLDNVLSKTTGEPEEQQKSMRDAILNVGRATRDIESTFMNSGVLPEIVISPLAIYRETDIKIQND